ncbi:hypothetical protein GALL_316110 [mine drainage metagenome]|uniref:Uncharacterized protein n=1 Tax=mine drainage metagenome TaxID=410659 RepID=A0A1J5REF3_9ZZZZ
MRQPRQMGDELERAQGLGVRAAHQRLVDLDAVERDTVHAQQRTVARAEVVLHDADAALAQRVELTVAPRRVARILRFQQFELQQRRRQPPARQRVEHRVAPAPIVERLGRHVQRHRQRARPPVQVAAHLLEAEPEQLQQAVGVERRQELARRDQRAVGLAHARQRLDVVDAAAAQIDDGLVVHLHRAVVEQLRVGPAQLHRDHLAALLALHRAAHRLLDVAQRDFALRAAEESGKTAVQVQHRERARGVVEQRNRRDGAQAQPIEFGAPRIGVAVEPHHVADLHFAAAPGDAGRAHAAGLPRVDRERHHAPVEESLRIRSPGLAAVGLDLQRALRVGAGEQRRDHAVERGQHLQAVAQQRGQAAGALGDALERDESLRDFDRETHMALGLRLDVEQHALMQRRDQLLALRAGHVEREQQLVDLLLVQVVALEQRRRAQPDEFVHPTDAQRRVVVGLRRQRRIEQHRQVRGLPTLEPRQLARRQPSEQHPRFGAVLQLVIEALDEAVDVYARVAPQLPQQLADFGAVGQRIRCVVGGEIGVGGAVHGVAADGGLSQHTPSCILPMYWICRPDTISVAESTAPAATENRR